jgi:ferredoxin
MVYVITESCVGNKDASCVEVCPVDCIQPTPDEHGFAEVEQLYIDPDECISCDACVAACPFDAPLDEEGLDGPQQRFIALNAQYFVGRQ